MTEIVAFDRSHHQWDRSRKYYELIEYYRTAYNLWWDQFYKDAQVENCMYSGRRLRHCAFEPRVTYRIKSIILSIVIVASAARMRHKKYIYQKNLALNASTQSCQKNEEQRKRAIKKISRKTKKHKNIDSVQVAFRKEWRWQQSVWWKRPYRCRTTKSYNKSNECIVKTITHVSRECIWQMHQSHL